MTSAIHVNIFSQKSLVNAMKKLALQKKEKIPCIYLAHRQYAATLEMSKTKKIRGESEE